MTTVLVVDDEHIIAVMIRDFLEDEGFRVHLALNGNEALRVMESEQIDLIITDLMMPLMRGDTFIKKLRVDPQYAHIPIILMSAVPHAREALGDHNIALLTKPFDLLTLLEAVEELL